MEYESEALWLVRAFEGGDELDSEPLENWATYGDYQLVGNGKQTNEFCGKYLKLKGCLRVDLHGKVRLDGKSYSGKVYVRAVRHSCDKPTCPICYEKGWAVREAEKIEKRLIEASKRFGQVEHLVISVPVKDYGLEYKALRSKVVKILLERGIIGGALIFHGFRYNLEKAWYWGVHFHVLGFILHGYGRCRNCENKWNCREGCGGFDALNYRKFLSDGYFIKVFGERQTIGGTAWYQLNHATIKIGVKRFQVVTWFGVCSYRKLKVTVERHKALCPICQNELVRVRYLGCHSVVLDCFSPDFQKEFFADYLEDGVPVWLEWIKSSRFRSGSSGD